MQVALAGTVLLGLLESAPLCADETRQWIWATPDRQPRQSVALWKPFEIEGEVRSATLAGVVDFCAAAVYLNDQPIARRQPYKTPIHVDVAEQLRAGKNELRARCLSVAGPAAIALSLDIEYADGRRQQVVSDETFRAARLSGGSLDWPNLDGADASAAHAFGIVADYPQGAIGAAVAISPLDDYEQWKRAIDAEQGTDAGQFQVPAGFEIARVHSAADDEGSWVSMTFDPQGRCIVAKEKEGLLRLTLPSSSRDDVLVENFNDELNECRGMLFAGGNFYAMANGDKGLFRLRDADGDGRFEQTERLATLEGSGGHGRNQMVLGPDGRLYCICGDAVLEPDYASSLPPNLAIPDRFEKTPSGFVARCDLDGKNWEIVVRGLRNPFGIAFNADGEMFTYDADAEYDMGSSWYRPTRIDHLLPGGDFGWRRVTKQWPPYFPDRPDMPQPTLDIGKGSPTAVVFGTGSKFLPQFSGALFALDWAYGRILAVHLSPRGSSYAAHAETFVRGQPANVTDVEFGPDGAMYFVTGGRATQSALYRVAFTGTARATKEPTAQQAARRNHAAQARRQRRALESLLGAPREGALAKAWPMLSSDDPWIRHIARAVVEWQPVEQWQERALRELRPTSALAALMALARVGSAALHPQIIDRVARLDWNRLSTSQKLEALFLFERCFGAGTSLSLDRQRAAIESLAPVYPDSDAAVNRRLAHLLSRHDVNEFIPRTIGLLDKAALQNDRLHYLFVLRNIEKGWAPQLRDVYFEQLHHMNDFIGGEGLPTFRRKIREEALANLPAAQREHYAELFKASPIERWIADASAERREFVKAWRVEDFSDHFDAVAKGRDIERGRKLFAAARCIACHQLGGRGGVSGPDLSSVSRRFSPKDLLVSLIEPSKVVSEKYQNDALELDDGRIIVGRILPGDYRSPTLQITPNLLEPEKAVTIAKRDIVDRKPSPLSPMPKGLLDTFTQQEVLDLLAFLRAASR